MKEDTWLSSKRPEPPATSGQLHSNDNCELQNNHSISSGSGSPISSAVQKGVEQMMSLNEQVLECINNREMLLQRLQERISQYNSRMEDCWSSSDYNHVYKLITGLRDSSLFVIEAIQEWRRHLMKKIPKEKRRRRVRFEPLNKNTNNRKKQSEFNSKPNEGKKGILLPDRQKGTPNPIFQWRGENYLVKMMYDSEDILEGLSTVLKPEVFNIRRNPFLLPNNKNVDDSTLLLIPKSNEDQNQDDTMVRQLDIERIQRASIFIITNVQKHNKNSDEALQLEHQNTGITDNGDHSELSLWSDDDTVAATTKLDIPIAPQLNRLELQDFSSMPTPPLSVAVVISSARILLGCDENSSVGKWNALPPLTTNMAFRLLQQPIHSIFQKLMLFNGHHHNRSASVTIPNHILKTLYPIVIHEKFCPHYMQQYVSRSVGELAEWVRSIVCTHTEDRIHPGHNRYDHLFAQDIVKITRNDPIIFAEWDECEKNDNLINVAGETSCSKKKKKTNRTKARLRLKRKKRIRKIPKSKTSHSSLDIIEESDYENGSDDDIITRCSDKNTESWDILAASSCSTAMDHNSTTNIVGESRKSNSNKNHTYDSDSGELRQMKEDKEDVLVPIPIPCLVIAVENSTNIIVSEGDSFGLERGDCIRIGNPNHSKDWCISHDPSVPLSSSQIPISRPYMHHKANMDDPKPNEEDNKVEEDKQTRWNNLQLFKLIPQKKDKRGPWRRQYDDGDVPWIEEGDDEEAFEGFASRSAKHFSVVIPWKTVEQSCKDVLHDPENCIHEQRVLYFEKVSVLKILEETFSHMCHWHPTSQAIDNVKWSKLARKMKFLSKVRNSAHEVDMAFSRQIRARKERKLNFEMFLSIMLDVALRQYPSMRTKPDDALSRLVWNTVVMLPPVNFMVWDDSKKMAMKVEAKRLCAQIRIASFHRRIMTRACYVKMQNAASIISKYTRRRIATRQKASTLQILMDDCRFRVRHLCAVTCQKIWRRFACKTNMVRIKERKRKQELDKIHEYRTKLNKRRRIRKSSIVFRQIRKIQSTYLLITMFLNDLLHYGEKNKLEIKVYAPTTQATFTFVLEENVLRDCMEQALETDGPLCWNEMLLVPSLQTLANRITVRYIKRRPTVIFSKRSISERGLLISKKSAIFSLGVFVVSLYRSPFDVVVCAYDPKSCNVLRTRISLSDLSDWLKDDEHNRRRAIERFWKTKTRKSNSEFSSSIDCDANSKKVEDNDDDESKGKEGLISSHSNEKDQTPNHVIHNGITTTYLPQLLKKENQSRLIVWLMKRIDVVNPDPKNPKCVKVVLQCETDEQMRQNIVCKIQNIWRAKLSQKCSRQIIFDHFEKAYDRDKDAYYYVNKKTGLKQWNKPGLLGSYDLALPKDEWRRVEEVFDDDGKDGDGGEKNSKVYYWNPGTGQTSWLSENDAARIVQRKFRDKHSSELLDTNSVDLLRVARIVRFVRDTEENYARSPNKLSHKFNYALLCHCLRFDAAAARPLLKDAHARSPCHPVVARAYAMFLLAACDAPRRANFELSRRLLREAAVADPDHTKFRTAFETFYHWPVVVNPRRPTAILNYALVYQCVFSDAERTERLYREALARAPTNSFVVRNWKLYEEERYPGGAYFNGSPSSFVLQRSEIARDGDVAYRRQGEWSRLVDPHCAKEAFRFFWFNNITKKAQYAEPDWEAHWKERVQRSRVCYDAKKTDDFGCDWWIEYWDEVLKERFYYNKSTKEYVVATTTLKKHDKGS